MTRSVFHRSIRYPSDVRIYISKLDEGFNEIGFQIPWTSKIAIYPIYNIFS